MTEKTTEKIVLELYEEIKQANPSVDFNKLNLLHLDYSYRVRYEKNGDGNVVAKVMDRGFIGLTGSKIGLDSLSSDSVYTCFIYGKRTIGAVINGAELFCNQNLKTSADFNVLMLNLAKEKELSVVWVDGLPTGEIAKKAPKTLSDLLNNVKTIEELSSDLGF